MPQPPHQPPNHHHNNHRITFPSNLNLNLNSPNILLTIISLFFFITSPKHHLIPKSLTLTYPSFSNRRHFRLSSSSSLLMSSNPNPNFNPFSSPKSLSDWLKPRLPFDSFAAWGVKPGTKNVHNLWLELSDGETTILDTTPPVRNLEVVCVRVFGVDDNKVLIESHQELSDGSVRKRDRPLSEKMKAGEDVDSAVKRAVREELGSVIVGPVEKIVRVLPGSYERKVEERASVSYPGLPACYVLHCVDAFVEGLPDGEFSTVEGDEYEGCHRGLASDAVSVRKHFWKWVPLDSV